MHPEATVEIYQATNARQAHLVVAMLAAEGIEGVVTGELIQNAWGEMPLPRRLEGRPGVRVPASDEARARAALAAWEESQDDAPGEPWTCAACGSSVEGTFDICWSCEAPRPTPTADA